MFLFSFIANIESAFKKPGENLRIYRKYLEKIGVQKVPTIFWIGPWSEVYNFGKIKIGRNFAIGAKSSIINWGKISIGNNFLGSNNIFMNSGDHRLSDLRPEKKQIVIGDNVFVGTNVVIVGNTKIGNNSVVGAGSVVRGTFPSNSLILGNPAKKVKTIDRKKYEIWKWHKNV